MTTKTTIQLRAQEIINANPRILVKDAIGQAITELASTLEEAQALLATLLTGIGPSLRKISYDLPENNGQTTFFDTPAWLIITSPEGDLAVHKGDATLEQVRQWLREGRSYHATQHLRFKRGIEDVAAIQDLDDETPWPEAQEILVQRQRLLVA